jgi:glycerophosphoryl diester phosphodiesterase
VTRPLIIGHRGASALAPENTLIAFERALADGADGLEFDVRLSRDMVPVVIHDADLKRTGGRQERVMDLTADMLARVDVGSWFNVRYPASANAAYALSTVPTLESVFELVRGTRATLYVELKPDTQRRTPLVKAVVDMIQRHGMADTAIVESFDLDTIAETKHLNSEIRAAALFERRLSKPIPSSTAISRLARDCGADELALHHTLATSRRMARFNDEGFPVTVWTVDNPNWVSRALELKVKALISNNPGRLLAALSGRGT